MKIVILVGREETVAVSPVLYMTKSVFLREGKNGKCAQVHRMELKKFCCLDGSNGREKMVVVFLCNF